jgi:hypothetical protein
VSEFHSEAFVLDLKVAAKGVFNISIEFQQLSETLIKLRIDFFNIFNADVFFKEFLVDNRGEMEVEDHAVVDGQPEEDTRKFKVKWILKRLPIKPQIPAVLISSLLKIENYYILRKIHSVGRCEELLCDYLEVLFFEATCVFSHFILEFDLDNLG